MADGITAVVASSNNRRQFQDVFSSVIPFTLVFEDDSIATDSIYSGGGLVAVPGAELGDIVLVFPVIDAVECHFMGSVQAAGQVEVTLVNDTAGTVTAFASGVTLRGIVLRYNNDIWNNISGY